MAVARVGTPVSGGSFGPVSSRSFSFTASGGANNLLVVSVGYYDGTNNATATATFNGVAMTSLHKITDTTVTKHQVESFGILNPAAGTHSVVITFSGPDHYGGCGAQEYSGVDAVTPASNLTGVSDSNGTIAASLVVTSAADDYAHFATLNTYGVTVFTGDKSEIFKVSQAGDTVWASAYDAVGASTVTLNTSWATNISGRWSILGFNIKAGVPVHILSGQAILSGITADGGMATQPDSSLSGQAILSGITADGGMGLAPGFLITPVLKNNTGTILASVTGIVANIYHPTTGVLVVRKTGLSSNGSGIVTITDALLAAGTTYAYEIDLSVSSQGRRLPTGVAA